MLHQLTGRKIPMKWKFVNTEGKREGGRTAKSHLWMALCCLTFMPLLVFLFEELVERVYLAVNFNRELTGHRAVENRDVAHSPFDSAVVKINDISVFVVKYLLFEINGYIGLRGQYSELNFPSHDLVDHLLCGKQFLASGGRTDLEFLVCCF